MNNKRLFYITHISFWLIYFAISVWVFSNFLSLKASFLRSFANGVPLFILVYANIWNVNTFFEKKKILTSLLIAIALILVFVPIRYYINSSGFFKTDFGFKNKSQTLILGIVMTNLLMIMFSAFYQILVNRFKKNKKQSEEIQVYQTAQLSYLRSQINPHFLFNTLNNIYSLAIAKSDKTPKMVLKLADILRYVVYQKDDKKVLLADEIKLIHHFIDLTKLKFETEPNIQFTIQGSTDNVYIEPMILIPIVENCFKHCDIDTNTNGFIKIDLICKDNTLFFTTENSKNDLLNQKDKLGGVGLENIKKRLQLTYNNQFSFKFKDENAIFRVDLTLEK
jgi:LytS/YehU family sensor histidine kinase